MSIKAVAGFTGLHWKTVKTIEKSWLAKKYKKVRLDDVSYMGIDEVYLGKRIGYITGVRDLESGAALFIGNGKGGKATFHRCRIGTYGRRCFIEDLRLD